MEEKINFTNFYNERLAGVMNNGRPFAPVILLVHGFCGNKDENGLFKECSDYFGNKSLNTFRFDISGIGESEGDYRNSSLEKQASDLNAAIKILDESYPNSKIGLVGFSLGATVALYCKNQRISAYSFWSPAFFPSKDMSPRYTSEDITKQLDEKGYFDKDGLKVGRQLLDDLKYFDGARYLQVMTVPIQIVHGTKDPRIDFNSSKEAYELLNTDRQLELISEANHSYKNNPEHRKQVLEKSADWFLKKLSSSY
jgi:hypothetical protein